MRVSGFTIVRNAIKMGYPARESILSILPICDEFIVNVGKSDDETLELVRDIASDKIKIVETEWEKDLREGGQVLSQQTNIALRQCSGDWAFYLQSDEVIHEKDHALLLGKMQEYLMRQHIEGLKLDYLHFYGSYDYYQDNYRKWYPREIRIIRPKQDIVSWGDAMDFRHTDGSKLKAARLKARVFHYGWVKPPAQMLYKKKTLDELWHDDQWIETTYQRQSEFDYPDRDFLVRFKGTHPKVMKERIDNYKFQLSLHKNLLCFYPIRKFRIILHPVTKRLKRLFVKKD